jgi:glycosyltransferase involved in cell wall biosynthesis
MSENHSGLISVIIPTFNAARYLTETLDSVLMQDWTSLEILVCDDGSTDLSVEIARTFNSRVQVAQGEHRGLAATRNRGIGLSRGQLILHLDADDVLEPGAISTLASGLTNAHDMVIGKFVSFISPDLPLEIASRYSVPAGPQSGHLSGTTLIRRAAFETYGLFDEEYGVGADLAWCVNAERCGVGIKRIDSVVNRRRIHGNNMSLGNRKEWSASVLRTVRAALKHRRTDA